VCRWRRCRAAGEGLGRKLSSLCPGSPSPAPSPRKSLRYAGIQRHRRSPVDLKLAVGILVIGSSTAPSPSSSIARAAPPISSNCDASAPVFASSGLRWLFAGHGRSPHRRACSRKNSASTPVRSVGPNLRHPAPADGAAPSRATAPAAGPPPADRWPNPGPHVALPAAAPPGWKGSGRRARPVAGHVQARRQSRETGPSRPAC